MIDIRASESWFQYYDSVDSRLSGYAEYKWLGLKASIEASLDKLGFGIILGYEM